MKDCEYGELTDSLLKDRIMCGIIDDEVRKILLQIDNMSLIKAISTCQVSEMNANQLRSLTPILAPPCVRDIQRVTNNKQPRSNTLLHKGLDSEAFFS